MNTVPKEQHLKLTSGLHMHAHSMHTCVCPHTHTQTPKYTQREMKKKHQTLTTRTMLSKELKMQGLTGSPELHYVQM